MKDKVGIFSTNIKTSGELYIYECGYEYCSPREPYLYEQIDYYLLHYILEGEGLFFYERQSVSSKGWRWIFYPSKY